jgi:ELWxxDGT repeat protein
MKRFLGRRLGGKGGLNQRRLRKPVIESLHERVVYAADMQFVKDINTLPDLVGSTPAEFVQIGTTMYFSATSAATGLELWKTDGTVAGTVLVKDIQDGAYGSGVRNLTNVNGTLFFSADDGVGGYELWKSDGTSAGTTLVSDIQRGRGGSSPSNFVALGSTLIFSANDGSNGVELWQSNGTAVGTTLVRNIRTGNVGSNPGNMTAVTGSVYFTADDGTNGVELWKTDGTNAGTVLVRNIRAGVASSTPSSLVNVNGTLYFSANDGTNGVELWKSSGTAATTVLVRSIFAGLSSANPTQLTNVGGTLYFAADDGTSGVELWKSDGTNAGTVRVADIQAGAVGSNPTQFLSVGTTLFFAAQTSSGVELWKSTGTAAGTTLVKDIQVGAGSSSPTGLKNNNGTVFFAADDGVNGVELWKTDGTAAGTVLVQNINTTAGVGSNPVRLEVFNGKLLFQANDGLTGSELWQSDGTAAGTTQLKDILGGNLGSQIGAEITTAGGSFFFSADDGVNGAELWMSNGTGAGTVLVKDIVVGAGGSGPAAMTNVGGVLYFSADDGVNGVELWKSDGTDAGTVLVKDIAVGLTASAPAYLTNVNGTLFFTATNVTSGIELWKSDGTATGTVMVRDINAGGVGSIPNNLTNANGTLYFVATDLAGGTELWKSDGTTAGTVRVKDIRPGLASGLNDGAGLVNVAGTLYFAADNGTSGVELWKSDGTDAGTTLVRDLVPGAGSSYPEGFANVGGVLYFSGTDGVTGGELWKSDGTTAGTLLVADSVPGAGGLYPHYITGVNGTVYFQGEDGVNGIELWKSDGTAAGTELLRDISPGLASSTPTSLVGVSGVVYFKANDGINGPELWQSDGTTAGTVRTTTVTSAPIGIAPSVLANFNNRLVFAAVDDVHGGELWAQVPNVAPTDIQISASVIAENSVAPTAIGDFSTTDLDVGDLFTYTIVAGVGDTDNASFEIVGGTLRAKNSFDFEAKPSYSVRVRSTDQGGLFTEKAFVISVTDVNEAPTDIGLSSTTILENSGANATVGTLSTVDVDASNTFSYALVAGAGDVDNGAFNISGNVLRATSDLNFATTSSYSIRVRSTDQGGLSFDKTFTIQVLQSNAAPTDINLFPGFVFENAGADASVGALSTTDPNAGNTFTYSLVAGLGDGDNAAFNVLGSTLRANASFDYETRSSYAVRVRTTDQGGLFTEKAFIVNVLNANEAPTDVILSGNQIVEGAIANTTVGLLSTIDVDASNSFSYTLVAGAGDADNAAFNISENALRATSSFDFETKSSYTVRVRTTDQGGLFTEKVFVITVSDVNEAPTDLELSSTTIPEDSGANAPVGTLSSTDPDVGNTFTYTLVAGTGGADNTAFNISGNVLLATDNLVFATKSVYTVRIRSTDQGGLFAERAFVINVLSVNSAPNDITLSSNLIAENSGANATVGSLSSIDANAGDTFTYTLVDGTGDTDNTSFNIIGDSVRATSNLDFETKSSYTVRVRSTDQGGLFTEKAFVITVSDANESPTDLSLSSSLIPENAGANATVGAFSSTDPDAGNTFTYSLVTGTGDTDNAAFAITGDSLSAIGSFDYEAKASYTVRVRSTDSSGLFTEKVFVVNVTNVNEDPTDIGLSSSLVAENAGANAIVGTLSTTDVDAGNTFTYSLVAGSGDGDNAAFDISGDALRATNSFDFETKASYTVRIRSVDQGGLLTEKVFVINVTNLNEAPTDIGLSSTSILENSGANATVGVLSTVDADASSTFTYSFIAGAGDADNAAFNISGDVLRATNNLSFSAKSSYTIRVRTTDQGGLSFDKSFTILVMQSNVAPTDLNLFPGFVFENAGVNVSVGALSTTDANAGDTFTYTLVAGLGDGDNAAFNVLGSSLRANSSFDYETRSSYAVRIRTTDLGGLFTEKAFIVSVLNTNEAPSDIVLTSSQIAENSVANTTVGVLSTIDVDAANSFAYTLVAGAGDTDNAAFNISGNALRATNSLDFENKSSYTLRVRSTDQGGLFTEKVFVISVVDVNEAPTDLALTSTSIPENSGANATVGTLSSTDPDASNTFVYELVAGAGDVDNASFNISGNVLRATNNLVFATKSSYVIRVRTTDQGGLFAERSFVINVTSPNTAPTDIALSSTSISENLGANATVGSLGTTDSNVGDTFTYTLVGGLGDVDNAAFNISGNLLRATNNLDFETKSGYTVRVRSTDQGGLFTEKAFAITVLDAPEDILIAGTAGNDTIIANYTGDGVVAQWLVTRNGGVVFSGIVPVGQNLWFDGLAGTDTLQVVGRSVDDSFTLDGLRIAANGAWTRSSNIESVRILGGNGNDLLRVVSGTASFEGGGGVDRVEATAGANTFTLTGNGTGNFNSSLTFTTIESVQGGIDSDRFVFGASGSLTGQVIGGLGVDTIDLSAKTGATTLNFVTGMLTSTGGFFGIESFVSGSNTADTVTGPNINSLWNITGPSAWNLNGEMTFNGFENLTGGTGADRFEFLPTGRVVGTLNGGAGADVASFAALSTPVQVQLGANAAITGLVGRYTAVERVNGNGLAGSRIVGSNATTAWVVNAAGDVVASNVTYSAIPAIAGGTAVDTVTGPAVATKWTLNGANAGSVTVGAVALAFTGVENLTGSTASDEFIVMPTGSLSGNLNGGTGTGINSVDYSAWSTNVVVNLSVTSAGNATGVSGAMTGIGMVTGGAGNDSLTGRATLSTILIGLGGNDVLIGGSQRDLLIGGTGADILQGAAGDDLLISGTTVHERDRAALLQILAEWTSTRTFAQRTANIWGNGTGTRANGTTYLNNSAADSITDSVFADTDTDLLTGGTNQDWFFAAPGEISDLVTAGATQDRRD